MRKYIMISALLTGSLFTFSAEAGRPLKREAKQQQRINDGVASGELTPAETARLEAQQARIKATVAKERADDGRLDAHERAKIERMQDRASRNINRQKHDSQKR
jgi:hypothetical protein